MKQIITQHGWGLNKHFWDDYKVDFLKNNWHWQDNERGYFSTDNYQAKWIRSDSNKEIKMTLCHSYGFHLMPKKTLEEATHIVLINSFNNCWTRRESSLSTKISRKKWFFSNCDKTSNCSRGAIKNQNNNKKRLRFEYS